MDLTTLVKHSYAFKIFFLHIEIENIYCLCAKIIYKHLVNYWMKAIFL